MKKFVSFLLVLSMLICCLAFVACDEQGGGDTTQGANTDGTESTSAKTDTPTEETTSEAMNEEAWQEAISFERFDNLTVKYTVVDIVDGTSDTLDTEQTVKIAGDKLYRKAVTMYNDVSMEDMEVTFEGEEAVAQKAMFFELLMALVEDKENYVYDAETGEYRSQSAITVILYPTPDHTVEDEVTMENGVVKFDDNGRLIYFSGKVTETVRMPGETINPLTDAESVWTIYDYGTTVIEE